jgi:hypothetical protein
MSISFPLSISQFWDAFHLLDGSSEFELLQYKLQSADGGGNTLSAKLGQPKWRADVEVAPQYHQETGRVSALLKALQGRDGTFLAYDRTKPYPVSDPDGVALADGSSVSVGGEAAFGNVVAGAYRYEGADVTLNQAISMASDAGSYFDADGFLQTAAANTLRVDYGPFANLLDLRYVNDFSNAFWAKANVSVTANAATAPDGTVTADKIVENSSTVEHFIERQAIRAKTNADICWSFYAKAAGRTRFGINIFDSVTANNLAVNINLATGTIVNSGAAGTASNLTVAITSAGDGWYRVKISGKAASTDSGSLYSVRMYLSNNSGVNNYAGDGVSGIYMWGAVVNYGATALTYPRQPLGVLAESSFTQMLLRSREYGNAVWTKSRATVTANVSGIVDPWGGTNANKLIEDTTVSNTHLIYQFHTTVNYVNHVTYAIAKAAERSKIQLQLSNFTTAAAAADFDLLAGTITNVVSGAEDLTGASAAIYDLGNGWYWCELKALKITGDSDCHPTLLLRDASGNTSYTGDGVSGIYLAHAQLEEGGIGHMPVITTSAPIQRAGDQIMFKARGTNDFTLAYDVGAEESAPGAVGNWSPLSAGFLRPRIKAWSATRKAQPGATSVQVKSKGANNRSLSLKGLLPFFSLSIGDRISVNYASGRRALLEVMEDVTANYLGETVEFEAQPFLSAGIQVDDTVDLTKPCGKFKIVNGSFKPASVEAKRSTGSGFSMISVP